MELFKITCVTCRAGLSVRNESLIGQIVACPKCGSMVHIKPPEPESAPPQAAEPVAVESTNFALLAWSAAGLALGATVLGAVLLWPSAPAVSDAAPTPDNEQPVDQVPTPVVARPEEPALETVATSAPAEPVTPEPKPVPPQEPAVTEEPAVEEEVVAEEKATEAPVTATEPPPIVPPAEEPRVATRQFNALDLDPEALDLKTLDQPPENPAAEPNSAEPPPSPEPVASTEPAARRGTAPERRPGAREAKGQFAREISSLSVKEMPLVDFLTLMSQLSGVPVSLGSEHLQMAGISPRRSVSLDAGGKTLDAMLAEVLNPLRLEHRFQGPHVLVTRQGAAQVREIEYPVDDLEIDAEQLASWIKQLIAPTSWQSGKLAVEGGALRIEQSQRVHYQVLVFLERLRLASGLSPRSKYPVQRLAPTPLYAALAKRLTAPALFTFSHETPLAEVFLHWQRELDLPLLVDWPALAEVDLWPESTIVSAVANKTWEQALDESLEPLGLAWQATFGGAIEISSAEKLEQAMQLELYPLAPEKAKDPARLVAQLQEHVPGGEVVFDPTARVLIVRQPASAQRKTLAWLTERQLLKPRD